jgi:hypothetical protein
LTRRLLEEQHDFELRGALIDQVLGFREELSCVDGVVRPLEVPHPAA